jgi:hypothetical protein
VQEQYVRAENRGVNITKRYLPRWYFRQLLIICICAGTLVACAGKPLSPYTTETTPMILLPISKAGIRDGRGRFREIYCAVLDDHGQELPDYRSCETALTRVGTEPAPTGRDINLGSSRQNFLVAIVPGFGWECFGGWLESEFSGSSHVAKFGYEVIQLKVDGLSGSENNARQIHEQIANLPPEQASKPLILLGYSKGAPDILQAVVDYPELAVKVVAVISAAGAVGGSALANNAEQSQANILTKIPKSDCSEGDGGAVHDMRPTTRQKWLSENSLPEHISYYSLATCPDPEHMSSVLKSSYRKLGKIDGRNDSQLIFYSQLIPGSVLVAYVNADHWALAVPISRTHSFVSTMFTTQNQYPREALFEAVLRYVEEDLGKVTTSPQ